MTVTRSKSITRISSKTFLLGFMFSFFLGINLLIAHTGFAQLYFMLCAAISCCILIYRPGHYLIILGLILSFPEYGANPYEENFFSPFYYQKYVFITFLLYICFTQIHKSTIVYACLLTISWLVSLIYEIDGRFLNEFVQLLIAICFVNCKVDASSSERLSSFLMVFISLSFIPSFMVDFFGLSSIRGNGSAVYLFGHWFGILCGLFLFKLTTLNIYKSSSILLMTFMSISIYININSFQSAHFIWIIICLCLALNITEKISFRKVAWIILLLGGLYFVQLIDFGTLSSSGPFSWLAMKMVQFLSIITFDVSLVSNSPLIRFNEAISLVQQSNFLQLLIGRGFASTYLLEGAFWDLAVLHEATFPEDQLELGRLQMVHETFILLFKWTGLLGILVFVFTIISKNASENSEGRNPYFMIALALLFLLSGVHTGILTLLLYKFGVGNKR